jgi:hypothetical protein
MRLSVKKHFVRAVSSMFCFILRIILRGLGIGKLLVENIEFFNIDARSICAAVTIV